MQPKIEALRKEFTTELNNTATTADLEILKVKYLGKKGPIQELMRALKDISPEQRPETGKWINDIKEEITHKIESRQKDLILSEENTQLQKEKIDITLPGRNRYQGRKHIISQTMDEMLNILIGMGFSVQYGPDIDTDY